MRVLTSALLFLSALSLVAADPQARGNMPDGSNNGTDGSMDHASSTGGGHSYMHMRGSGSADDSWDGSGSRDDRPIHHCDYPPMNGSMSDSDDSYGSWDGSRNGSHHHGRLSFNCEGSNSSDDDIHAIKTPVPSATSSATKQVVLAGGSLMVVAAYLLA